ncbi:uncharacterized protein LOC62_05G007576 [Vanrija pseudolonga]|uniref:Uncharacterized protein n=1 Tax=Vanrija pseudolonga TaxID=143232 RepID=A0AAF0YI66_9TREE|nr:hypothetical protein LOC62_05G007576 [Vanrija pseudolonga]
MMATSSRSFPRTAWCASEVLDPSVTPHARRLRTAARDASLTWELAVLDGDWKAVDEGCVALCILAKADELVATRELDDWVVNAVVWVAYEMAKDAAPRKMTFQPYTEVFSFVSKALYIMCLPPKEAAAVTIDVAAFDPIHEAPWTMDGEVVKDTLAEAVLRCFEHVYDAGVEHDTDDEGTEGSSTMCSDDGTQVAREESGATKVAGAAAKSAKPRPYTWPLYHMALPTIPLLVATNGTPPVQDVSLPFDVVDLDRLVVPGVVWEDEVCAEAGGYIDIEVEDNNDNDNVDNDNGDTVHNGNDNSDNYDTDSDSDVQCHPDCFDPFNCRYDASDTWDCEEDYVPVGRVVELEDMVSYDVPADIILASLLLDKLQETQTVDAVDLDLESFDKGVSELEPSLDSIDHLIPVFDIDALPDMTAILATELSAPNMSDFLADAPNMSDFLANVPDMSDFVAPTPDTSDEFTSADADGESDSFEYDDAGVWGL